VLDLLDEDMFVMTIAFDGAVPGDGAFLISRGNFVKPVTIDIKMQQH